MKKFLREIVLYILNIFYRDLGSRASILMYHSVGGNSGFSVKKSEFERQMTYLHRKKYKIVSLVELVKKIKNHESINNHVAITFDDGYKDNFMHAFPVLKKYSIPFTIFLITDSVGKTISSPQEAPALSLYELQEMGRSGLLDVMPHSVTHRSFTKINMIEVVEEIDNSQSFIKNIFDGDASIFCFPKGLFNNSMIDYLKLKKWDAAVTVKEGLISSNDDVYTLKRNAVDSSVSFNHFQTKVSQSLSIYLRLKYIFK